MTHVKAPSLSLRETRWEPEVEQGGNNSPVSLSKPVNCRDSIVLKWSWPWRCMFDINLYTYTYTYVYIYIWLYIYIHAYHYDQRAKQQWIQNPKYPNPWPLGPLAHHGKHVLRQRCDEGLHKSHSGDGQQSQLLAHISSFLDTYELNTGNLTVCYEHHKFK